MSNFMSLNGRDLIKGAVIAVLVAILGSLESILSAGALPTVEQWASIAKMAGAAVISYLVKNLFTNSQDELLKADK